MKNFIKNYWAIFVPLIVLAIALVYLLKNKTVDADQDAVIGMVDADFVDVTASLPGRLLHLLVKVGDEVIVFGGTELPFEKVAEWSHTICYEIVCAVSPRVPRVYVRDI